MSEMYKKIIKIFGKKLNRKLLPDPEEASVIEMRLERKLSYIFRLLGIYATTKSIRKTLPVDQQYSKIYEGHLANKSICGWEQDFIRNAIKDVLNMGVQKMRFYIDIIISNEKDGIFPSGKMKISLYYFIHKREPFILT